MDGKLVGMVVGIEGKLLGSGGRETFGTVGMAGKPAGSRGSDVGSVGRDGWVVGSVGCGRVVGRVGIGGSAVGFGRDGKVGMVGRVAAAGGIVVSRRWRAASPPSNSASATSIAKTTWL
ncbi:hypothetical protein NL676_015946 [Syzygium grande]|nr:hypothetical protein NL676_015946 [Syzygium grande]